MSGVCFYSILVRLKVYSNDFGGYQMKSFYSILVRLKDDRAGLVLAKATFLFHTGSIKSVRNCSYRFGVRGFYSILVRLKDLANFTPFMD